MVALGGSDGVLRPAVRQGSVHRGATPRLHLQVHPDIQKGGQQRLSLSLSLSLSLFSNYIY